MNQFCIFFDFRANYLIATEENIKSETSFQIRNLHVSDPANSTPNTNNNSRTKTIQKQSLLFYKAVAPKNSKNPLRFLTTSEATLTQSLLCKIQELCKNLYDDS